MIIRLKLRGLALSACAALALFTTVAKVAAQAPEVIITSPDPDIVNVLDTDSVTVFLVARANVGELAFVNMKLDDGDMAQALPTGVPLANGWVGFYAQYDNLSDGSHTFKAFPVDDGGFGYARLEFETTGGGGETFLEWADLPVWANPTDVGSLMSYNQVGRAFEISWNEEYLHYSDINTGHAALRFARTTGDSTLAAQIIERYRPLRYDSSNLIERNDHGKFLTSLILFEEYKATGNIWYYDKAMDRAEGSWQTRNNWSKQDLRENRRFWSDDFYLSDLVNSDYYRITPDPLAIDRMTKWLVVHLQELQVKRGENKGLLVHHRGTNVPWGRGCGWAALGLTEGLRTIPPSDPDYAYIMQGYVDLMDAIVSFQCADNLWGQVIDCKEEWTETSASALFVYALVVGIDNGWLDIDQYGPTAKSGWLALVRKVDADGNLADVCIGTTARFTDAQYLSKTTQLGDMHGQAPMIWAAEAMLRDEY